MTMVSRCLLRARHGKSLVVNNAPKPTGTQVIDLTGSGVGSSSGPPCRGAPATKKNADFFAVDLHTPKKVCIISFLRQRHEANSKKQDAD
ncbi:hypothetical protein [Bordetella genomosp. 13]|uniref:hypothetical protein n=1 Tax=Bordetella genomosp. 13 TaxID=463040 RepID=UPI0012FB9011|nr:hypothetical protein [Bordetella genomosp. 13]